MVKVIENLFTDKEIAQLTLDCDARPVATYNNIVNINKNLDYQFEGSVSRAILKPKLDLVFGLDHVVAQGCYKINSLPLGTHIDNAGTLYKWEAQDIPAKHQAGMIIPLNENEHFCTVTFEVYSDTWHGMSELLPAEHETGNNDFDLTRLDHIAEPARSQIHKFNIDTVFPWKLGNAFIWNKNQLHCSTNFAKFGLEKKFILLFIA
jgi:hypothetical protein